MIEARPIILLTHERNEKTKVRIFVHHIVSYYKNPAPLSITQIGSVIETVRGTHTVLEKPEVIDDLLKSIGKKNGQ